MSRDDSGLYSGITSTTQTRLGERNQERKEVKQAVRQKLLPAGEIVQAEFKKELDKLMYAPYPNEDTMTDVHFRVERRARRLAVESILAIQGRLNNLLRTDGRADS